MENKRESVYLAALAGLLHDVGKFTGRAGIGSKIDDKREQKEVGYWHAEHSQTFVDAYVLSPLRARLGVVRYHHRPDRTPTEQSEVTALARLVHLADGWSAGERITGMQERSAAGATPLLPILSQLKLVNGPSEEQWKYRVQSLVLTQESLFPVNLNEEPVGDLPAQYKSLWDKEMRPELDAWKRADGWEKQDIEAYFTTLMALLQKYLTFVPSATPWQADEDDRVVPDVSLYDHLKTTAAIAACLRAGFNDTEIMALTQQTQEPVAVLVRGDLSGIQDFIYRITRPDGERSFRETARRLRGRSFHLTLLGEVVAQWLIRSLGLTPANLLFCGGGRFDILAPRNAAEQIEKLQRQLEDWLLDAFHGELAIAVACEPVSPQDFSNMRQVYLAVENSLADQKERKWRRQLTQREFFVSERDEWDACPVCQLEASQGVCRQCTLHARIGRILPRVAYLALLPGQVNNDQDDILSVTFEKLDTTAVLLTERGAEKFLPAQKVGAVYRLTDSDFRRDAWGQLGQGFRFLANSVPTFTQPVVLPGRETDDIPHAGDGLDFEEIAYLSTGSQKLGVLKADVDHLGLLFSEALEPLTISRLAALSGAIDRFFSGYVNVLTQALFEEWQQGEGKGHPWRDKVDGLFYVAYAGGDDLFIIGPWDATISLAQRLENEWRTYACENPDVTLSAGIVLAKPHHPIQRMATAVSIAEKKAKDEGRNRCTLFGRAVEWLSDTEGKGLTWALNQAQELQREVEGKQFPRTLIHDLGRLYRYQYKPKTGEPKPLWRPHLYYVLTRRLGGEREKWRQIVLQAITQHTLPIIVSYVSLITRRD